MSLAACSNLPVSTPQSEEEKESEKTAESNNSIDRSRGQIDPCSLITREEVEAALGRTVMEPTRGNEIVSPRAGTMNTSCMFGSDEGFVSLNIKQRDPASRVAWNAARSYEELKGIIFKSRNGESSGRLEEIPGIGVDAFAETKEETMNYQTTELRVLSKYSILTVRVVRPSAISTLEAAKTLAGKAILRLDKYEMNAAIPTSDPTPVAPAPATNLNNSERPKAPEKSRAEPKIVKEVEPSRPRKNTKATSAKVENNNSRRADKPGSKESKRASTRAVNRNKRESAKAVRASARGRRRQ